MEQVSRREFTSRAPFSSPIGFDLCVHAPSQNFIFRLLNCPHPTSAFLPPGPCQRMQVCNLMWSKNINEIVSTHGYSLNQIIVWRYPSMTKVTTLTGHTMR